MTLQSVCVELGSLVVSGHGSRVVKSDSLLR